jgi:hypothetical protein
MGGLMVLAVPALVVMVALGVAAARRSPPSRETAVAAARTHAVRAAAGAVAVGVLVAALVAAAGSTGRAGITALLVPITFGVVHTVVLAAGELTWPRPQGEVRRARLDRRGLLDAAPRWLVRTAVSAVALAVVVIAGGALLADPTGSGFTYQPDDLHTAGAGPFPGLAYGIPAALGLLVLAAATGAALRIVADRPAVATEDERIEEALRRASAHRVLRAFAGVTFFVAGGLLFVAGGALHSVASSSVPSDYLGLAGAAAAVGGLAAMLAGVALTCVRAPGVPADTPVVLTS